MTFRPTTRDPDLPHQPVAHLSPSSLKVTLTCNCRDRARAGIIGIVVGPGDTARLYNDAANHVEPFGVGDRLYRMGP